MDFGITMDGELIIDNSNLDIKTVSDDEERFQQAFCRIQSVMSNWRNEIGANLEEVISMPINSNTFKIFEDKIINSLIKDHIYSKDEIHIEMVNNENYIEAKVYLRNKDTITCRTLNVKLDLVFGINITIGE